MIEQPSSYTPQLPPVTSESQQRKGNQSLPDKIAFGSDQLKFRFPQGVLKFRVPQQLFVYARRNLLRII